MSPWLIEILVGIVITTVIGIIGYFIKNAFINITNKLDEVILNQNSQKVSIIEMKKDIELAIDISKHLKLQVVDVSKKIHEHDVVLAELKEWKKNKEN